MKKFKFRFSYFLILGFIGIIFQMIGFFSWENINVSQAQLISSSSTEQFELYMKHNYFAIVSAAFLIAFALGIILCSKKEQLLFKIGGYSLGISQLFIAIITIVYLVYVDKNRLDMFKTAEEYTVYKTIGTLVNLKYTGLMISSIGLLSSSLGLVIYKGDEKIAKAGGIVGLISNGLFLIGLLLTSISGIFTYSYDIVNGFISFSQKIAEPYELLFSQTNGFTLGQLNRVVMLLEEIDSYSSVASFSLNKLTASAVIALITLICNVVTIVGNMFFLALAIIQSFDVSKDDKPMEI